MSKRRAGDWAWTANRQVYVPDRKISQPKSRYVYVPLRGYSAHLAVFDGDKCIGWIDTRTLGYEKAKDWIAATNWKDGDY